MARKPPRVGDGLDIKTPLPRPQELAGQRWENYSIVPGKRLPESGDCLRSELTNRFCLVYFGRQKQTITRFREIPEKNLKTSKENNTPATSMRKARLRS